MKSPQRHRECNCGRINLHLSAIPQNNDNTMSIRYFPLRWESTGDQWWYASPIDCAAANGHYDLVRELLRIDNNHLFKLTSLRRIRRLELVWDEDEEQFSGVAKHRSEVAQKLLLECESKRGENKKKKNSLMSASYGGWLMYTAASAGDLGFVQQLLRGTLFWCLEKESTM